MAHTSDYKNIQQFARHGGPDLSELRWHPEPDDDRVISLESPTSEKISASPWDVMDDRTTFLKDLWTEGMNLKPEEYEYISVGDLLKGAVKRYASHGSSDLNADLQDARARLEKNRPNKRHKPSTAYNSVFSTNLRGSHIYSVSMRPEAKPGNLEQARHYLSKRRASLSAKPISEKIFNYFAISSHSSLNESTVGMNLVHIIVPYDREIRSESEVDFDNFTSITNGQTVDAHPNLYDGMRMFTLEECVLVELEKFIKPAKKRNFPIVPNFFLEFEGIKPSREDVDLRASYDGALGARCMHKLRNYGCDEESYDGNAYSWSATLRRGVLRLYAHHVTAARFPDGKPDYRMTQIWGGDMCCDLETLVKGITALRNLRDFALAQRKEAVNEANVRAKAMAESKLENCDPQCS